MKRCPVRGQLAKLWLGRSSNKKKLIQKKRLDTLFGAFFFLLSHRYFHPPPSSLLSTHVLCVRPIDYKKKKQRQ